MKLILSASAIAMVIAGIYGAADMSKDIKQGTMIDYEKNTRPLARVATKYDLTGDMNAPLKEKITAYLDKKKKDEEEAQKKLAEQAPVVYEYFSRGEPIDYREVLNPLPVDTLTATTEVPPTAQENTNNDTETVPK
jgi:hypothetical protein